MLVGGLARRHRLVRIILFEFVQGEADALRKAQGFGHRFGAGAEQPRHFLRRFQMPFGIGLKPLAGLFQGHMLADAGDDILQLRAVRDDDTARH